MLMTPRTPRHSVTRQGQSGIRNRPVPRFQLSNSPEQETTVRATSISARTALFESPNEPATENAAGLQRIATVQTPPESERSQNDSTISIGESSSEDILILSPPRPATAPPDRPLVTSTPTRPTSALPAIRLSPLQRNQRHREIRPLTFAKTPHCARPTKAWMARFQPAIESQPEERPPQKRCSKEVWERLTACKPIMTSVARTPN